MNAHRSLSFLRQLISNNNREWFQANKELYLACKADFEQFTTDYINAMLSVEPQLAGLKPADCMWRIYRDTRFSLDKTPYKNHFGTFLAQKGGKKSQYGGYYFHLQPDACMFAAGMWCPEKDLMLSLRQSVYDNYDELEDLMQAPSFRRYFTDFDSYYSLKTVPHGYPRDFEHADWLKLKTFTITCPLSEEDVCRPDFLDLLVDISKAAKPLNDFLNYTLEEF